MGRYFLGAAAALLLALLPATASQAAPTMFHYQMPLPASQPVNVTLGGDGNVWFTEANHYGVGKITQSGATASEFSSGLTWGSNPTAIARGPDGNLWFTEAAGNGAIGRITSTGAITAALRAIT